MAENPGKQSLGDKRGERFSLNFLAVLLVLFTPFLVFVESNNYLFAAASFHVLLIFSAIAVVIAGLFRLIPRDWFRILVLTILLLLFIDFQFDWIDAWDGKLALTGVTLGFVLWIFRAHAAKLLVVVFGTATVASLGSPLLSGVLHGTVFAGSAAEKNKSELPLYVHIILDGQIGVEGLDHAVPSHRQLQTDLRRLFAKHDFRLFGRAYSPYFDTRDSISSTMNLRVSNKIGEAYTGETHSNTLLENAYFEKLQGMGYALKVYQSTFMDFCKTPQVRIENCMTYNYYGFSSADLEGLTDFEKLRFVALTYEKLSILVQSVRYFYRALSLQTQGLAVKRSELISWTGTFGPIPALPVFDQVIKDVATTPRGTMIFAHLLIPHSPYSVDAGCSIRRPILIWNKRVIEHVGPQYFNTPESRREHYEEYIAQDRCALAKLDELMNVLKSREDYKDIVVIVHGDHGSRITLVEPRVENSARMTRQDYFDGFSTLYAIKTPGIPSGYDSRMAAHADLLRTTMPGGGEAAGTGSSDTKPTVFFRYYRESDTKFGLHEFAMPELPTSYP
jgi:hypothetical protein